MLSKALAAIGNLLGIGANITDPKQYTIKKIKRLEYRIEAAMQYVFVDERSGRYKNISSGKKAEMKTHYRKRIFDVQ
jgi:hypothetical protein